MSLVAGLYIKILPNIYLVQDVRDGIQKAGPEFFIKGSEMLEIIWPIQVFFWTCLWCVKVSLLLMFKRLTERVPLHRTLWWIVMGTVILVSIAIFVHV